MELEQTADCLDALGNATRLDIYRMLVRAGHGGLAVGAIQQRAMIPRSTLSHHLRQLIAVGLVTQERQGTTLICRAEFDVMKGILTFLAAECCVDEADNAEREQGSG